MGNIDSLYTGRTSELHVSPSSLVRRIQALECAMRPSPIVTLRDDRVELYAKLEGQNLIGSIKDRPAYWVLRSAILRKELTPEVTVIESSSGNFAAALAFFCKSLNLQFIPVVDPSISKFYRAVLEASCNRVEMVQRPDDAGGFLKARLRKVAEVRAELPASFWPNQYANMDAMEAHYRFAGTELATQLDELDYLFVGVSSGGSIAGISRRVKERFPHIRIVAVDAEGSVIFGRQPKKRHIPGIGSSICPELIKHALIDDVVVVPEIESVQGCHELRDRHGLFVGGSTGSVYAAIKHYFARDRFLTRPKVAFTCADRGIAYVDTIYNDEWIKKLDTSSAVEILGGSPIGKEPA